MPIIRTFLVSFNPATVTPSGFMVAFDLTQRGQAHRVEASTLPELEREVRRLAVDYGQTCSPYVRLATTLDRKPAGFDKWANGLRVIEVEPIRHAPVDALPLFQGVPDAVAAAMDTEPGDLPDAVAAAWDSGEEG